MVYNVAGWMKDSRGTWTDGRVFIITIFIMLRSTKTLLSIEMTYRRRCRMRSQSRRSAIKRFSLCGVLGFCSQLKAVTSVL